jgi:hypothetical protein
MTETESYLEFMRMKLIRHSDPGRATSIERDLATAALLALESGDIPRARTIAKLALDAQHVPFRRC